MKKRIIYILGNPLEKIDKLSVSLTNDLQKIFKNFSFIKFDPTEELPKINKKLVFIDNVLGVNKLTLFTDLNNFLESPRYSAHDFDLYLNLSILKKLGKIEEILIIGLPIKCKKEQVLNDVKKILSEMKL